MGQYDYTLDTLREKLREYKEAEHQIILATKDAVKFGLVEAFANPTVENVIFGICTAPYNDENPGQGAFGPRVNSLPDNFDAESDDGSYEIYNGLCYYHYGASGDDRVKLFREAINTADWKFVANALGVSYYEDEGHGSQALFVAVATGDGNYDLNQYDMDY